MKINTELKMKCYDCKLKKCKKTLLNRIRANRYRDSLDNGTRDKHNLKLLKERWFLRERVLKIKWTKMEEIDTETTWDELTIKNIVKEINDGIEKYGKYDTRSIDKNYE
jgi:uncharacterized metal-binding protein